MYMHIVYITITLHIQVLVYCKNVPTLFDYRPTQNLCTPLYTSKTIGCLTAEFLITLTLRTNVVQG